MDQFTRRIIGFAVHAGDCDGVSYCWMFNEIISGKALPKYLSSDNDPLFLFQRWCANLRVIEIDKIKSVPGTSTSHPFIERVIGTTRREFLEHFVFFNKHDLQTKLDLFQAYYNEERAHSSLEMRTPEKMVAETTIVKTVVSLHQYRWKSDCRGLYQLPVAA